ncbi:MAG TPA: hypothetical protein VJ750_01870 [Rhizomicrobium sp.]|nr:hypothetical protein [Rhizomicrobium sp.]
MAKPNRKRKARSSKKKAKKAVAKTCFVISPFGSWFDECYDELYMPAIEAAGIDAVRGDDIYRPGTIIHDVWELTKSADIILADLSTKNANVFYELGLAHAIKKPVVLVTDNIDDVPFDLRHLRVIEYDKNQPNWGEELKAGITAALKETIKDPSRAILATFLEANQAPKAAEVSNEQKDLIAIKQDLEALRVGMQDVQRREQPRRRIHSIKEMQFRIDQLLREGAPRGYIFDYMVKRGIPASMVLKEIDRATHRHHSKPVEEKGK